MERRHKVHTCPNTTGWLMFHVSDSQSALVWASLLLGKGLRQLRRQMYFLDKAFYTTCCTRPLPSTMSFIIYLFFNNINMWSALQFYVNSSLILSYYSLIMIYHFRGSAKWDRGSSYETLEMAKNIYMYNIFK